MIAWLFQGMIGIDSAGGTGSADSSGCEAAMQEEWAHFFNSEDEGASFYNKINDLVEDTGTDIALVSAIITFRSDISVDNNYKCNVGETDEEGNVTKEECSEDLGEAAPDSKELYQEAKEIVKGVEGKSDDEVKKWLEESYLEGRLEELEVELPDDPESRKDTIKENVDLIFTIRDSYKEMLCKEEETSFGTSCVFHVKDKKLSNVRVKLLGCTASGGDSGPIETEELVDLEKYVLGVTNTENGGAPDEALKMQAIAARSYLLTRSSNREIKTENESSIVQIRNCTWDQAYCDPDKGCWSNGVGGEGGNTIFSGYDSSKTWSKKAIAENAKIRKIVASTAGQVVVDKNGKVVNTDYMQAEQTKWNQMANEGKSVIEMVKATYPNAVEITSNCVGMGNGTITGNPNFSNEDAWKDPNNPYAPNLYGQCTWFAWGRFYEIYGFSPGFTGNGVDCARQTVTANPDKFELSKTPKVGAVGSAKQSYPYGHVFIVTKIEGDKITFQEGNYNGTTDSWNVAITDWGSRTMTLSEMNKTMGGVEFANPKISPQ